MLKASAAKRFRRAARSLTITAAAPAVTTRQKPPPNDNYVSEEGLYDCIVVGGGISGLVTAQAFVSDHPQTVKRWAVFIMNVKPSSLLACR